MLLIDSGIFIFIQGFTYVAPSVLEEMYTQQPRVVHAKSPRRHFLGSSHSGSLHSFSPRTPDAHLRPSALFHQHR